MELLINQMKYFAAVSANQRMDTRWGTVKGYDPETYSVKLLLQPDEIETGWVPLLSPWAGNGWGMICPPSIGDMCEMQFQEGHIDNGFACMRAYNSLHVPPQDGDVVDPGSFLLQNEAGASFKFKVDGSVEIKSASGIAITLDSDSEVKIGDSAETLYRFVIDTFKDLFNTHEHLGSGQPPKPAFLMTDVHLSTVTKGN